MANSHCVRAVRAFVCPTRLSPLAVRGTARRARARFAMPMAAAARAMCSTLRPAVHDEARGVGARHGPCRAGGSASLRDRQAPEEDPSAHAGRGGMGYEAGGGGRGAVRRPVGAPPSPSPRTPVIRTLTAVIRTLPAVIRTLPAVIRTLTAIIRTLTALGRSVHLRLGRLVRSSCPLYSATCTGVYLRARGCCGFRFGCAAQRSGTRCSPGRPRRRRA